MFKIKQSIGFLPIPIFFQIAKRNEAQSLFRILSMKNDELHGYSNAPILSKLNNLIIRQVDRSEKEGRIPNGNLSLIFCYAKGTDLQVKILLFQHTAKKSVENIHFLRKGRHLAIFIETIVFDELTAFCYADAIAQCIFVDFLGMSLKGGLCLLFCLVYLRRGLDWGYPH